MTKHVLQQAKPGIINLIMSTVQKKGDVNHMDCKLLMTTR